jgi:hypothetical protein
MGKTSFGYYEIIFLCCFILKLFSFARVCVCTRPTKDILAQDHSWKLLSWSRYVLLLWYWKDHFPVHRDQPLGTVLSHFSPVYILKPYFCKMYYIIILVSHLYLPNNLFRSGFATKTLCIFSHSLACMMSQKCHPPWFSPSINRLLVKNAHGLPLERMS